MLTKTEIFEWFANEERGSAYVGFYMYPDSPDDYRCQPITTQDVVDMISGFDDDYQFIAIIDSMFDLIIGVQKEN